MEKKRERRIHDDKQEDKGQIKIKEEGKDKTAEKEEEQDKEKIGTKKINKQKK